jgi:hypothetical protein
LLMQHSSSCASRPQPSPPKDRDTEKETAFPVAKQYRLHHGDVILYGVQPPMA